MKFSDKGNRAFVVGETRKFGAPKLRCNTPTFATGEATGTGQLQVEAAFVRRPVFPAPQSYPTLLTSITGRVLSSNYIMYLWQCKGTYLCISALPVKKIMNYSCKV